MNLREQHADMLADADFLMPHVAVVGTPCNPFSVYGTKRFRDGAQAHAQFSTTFKDLKVWLEDLNPPTAILEQVVGFTQRISPDDARTPLQMFHGRMWVSSCWDGAIRF